MKREFLYGIALVTLLGGTFVACGDGDVTKLNPADADNALMYDTTYYNGQISSAMAACEADPVCEAKMNGTSYAQVSSSSSEAVTPDPTPDSSAGSSSSTVSSSSIGSLNSSSSSITIINPSSTSGSSSSGTISSSSAQESLSGSCAPVPATINKGETTTWTFSPKGTAGLNLSMTANFVWKLDGSTEQTSSGVGAKTATATYTKADSYTASVVINDTLSLTCSELQVNGAAITGCECTPDVTTADVEGGAKPATVTWTVSGCKTDANITTYEWTDANSVATGTSATATIDKKGTTTPTVKVSNDDGTTAEFTCAAFTATDSKAPEYEITDQTGYTVEAGTYSMLYACSSASEYYQPPVVVSDASGNWTAISVTYSGPAGNEQNLTGEPSYTIAFANLYGSWSSAPTELFTITVNQSAKIACQ